MNNATGQQQNQEESDVGFGFDGAQQQQGFTGMDWNTNSGFNPMMMQNAGFGGFPQMMGKSCLTAHQEARSDLCVPGMPGMNPMNMPFGGFGGMGMNDMSGMNMGMGFGGGFGGWNGQQGMGGNFGAGNYPNGGYNQQQMHQGPYGSQMHHQQFPNHNYQNRFHGQAPNRGYGRGRGGYGGRGGRFDQFQGSARNYDQMANGVSGYPQVDDASFSGQMPQNIQDRPQSQAPSTDGQQIEQKPSVTVETAPSDAPGDSILNAQEPADMAVDGQVQTFEDADKAEQDTSTGVELSVDDAERSRQIEDGQQLQDQQNNNGTASFQDDYISPQGGDGYQNGYMQDNMFNQYNNQAQAQAMLPNATAPYGSMDVAIPGAYQQMDQQPYGYQGRGRGRGGYGRGGFRGRGGYNQTRGGYGGSYANGVQPGEDVTVLAGADVAPPIDAPKGPKAMREGLPNSGIYSRPGLVQQAKTPGPPIVEQEQRERTPAQEASERGREISRSRSRSSSRHRKRKHRDRTMSRSEHDEEARERRRERRRRHEKRYDDERRDEYTNGDGNSKKGRSRSSSPGDDSSRRNRRREKDNYRSSRSHRDYSKD